jgi:hypothetical protein
MHETYRILAEDRIREQIREAAAWRLAAEARPTTGRSAWAGLTARVRTLLTLDRDQAPASRPVPAPTAAAGDAASCA